MLSICLAQVGVFSATLPPEALEITRKFMNKPVGDGVRPRDVLVSRVEPVLFTNVCVGGPFGETEV